MNDFTNVSPSAATVIRWGARILSVLILMFWGYFIVAHIFGDAGRPSRPLVWQDHATLTALIASLAGLAVAWKWELAGGAMTLLAVLVGAFVNPGVLAGPYTLIPITAVMHLSSWWMSSARGRKQAIRTLR
jgi:hypothetical protein